MGKIKGQVEYEKWQKGNHLTRKQVILANCFMCNGLEESNEDCQGTECPLYPFQPYRGKKRVENPQNWHFEPLKITEGK